MTIKEEIQIEEYKRTFAEAYKQGFMDAISVCKTESQTTKPPEKCYKCKWWDYSYGCQNPKGICEYESYTERSE